MSGSALSGRRVLVVEDQAILAMLLQNMLADLECEVAGTAARVETALAMIDKETFDAVVLDVNLNGEKSYAVADALVARGVPFVFSTGYDESALTDGYPEALVLQKPFKLQELGKALEALLSPAGAMRGK